MRLAKADPQEKRPVAGCLQESGKGIRHHARVPLKLTLCLLTVMRLRHVPGEVTLRLEQRGQDSLATLKRSMEVLGAGGVRVLAGEHADAGRTALGAGAECPLNLEPSSGEPVDVWSPNEAVAVHAYVAPAEVIGDKSYDVRRRVCTGLSGSRLRGDSQRRYY
jgi:hypothetical protein